MRTGEREWELGVDASVAVAKIGAGGDIDATNLKNDIVSFIFGQAGLIAMAPFTAGPGNMTLLKGSLSEE